MPGKKDRVKLPTARRDHSAHDGDDLLASRRQPRCQRACNFELLILGKPPEFFRNE